jgi:hypothetical protein
MDESNNHIAEIKKFTFLRVKSFIFARKNS